MLKARQKTVSLLVACLTMLCAMFFALVGIFSTPTTTASAATSEELSAKWERVTNTSTLAAEDKIVIVAAGSNVAMSTTQNSNNRGQTGITKSSDKSTVTITSSVQVITLKASSNSSYPFHLYTGSGYLYAASTSKNYLKTQDSTNTTSASWSISVTSAGVATVKANQSAKNWLRHNSSSSLFSCYDSGQADISIYKMVVSDEPKENFTVDFVVPTGITAVSSQTVEDGTYITLPTANTINGYLFAGWVEQEIPSLTEAKPSILSGDYRVTENKTLYAVYHNDVQPSGWTVVSSTSALATGDIVTLVCPSKKVALGKASGSYFTGVDVSISNNTFVDSDNVLKLTLTKNSDGSYSFHNGTSYLALTSESNALHTNTSINTQSSWKLTISNNTATITNVNLTDRKLQWNASSPRFACYTSAQTAVAIYKYVEGETLYYTTDIRAKIDGANLTVGENLKLNYIATLSEAFADATMYFEFDGKTIDVEGVEQADGRYAFSLEVPPQAMGKNVSAVLMHGDVELDKIEEYSIKQYAINKLNAQDSSAELKQLLTDMLYYGAAAQAYNGETTNLVTEGVENLGTPSSAVPTEEDNVFALVNAEVDEFPVYFKSANVKFGDVNNIRVTLSTYNENVSLTVNGTAVDLASSVYTTEGILATGFATEYTFVLSYNGEVMQTLTYSVNSYAYKMQNNDTIGTLALALYNYGKSAVAYNK